MLSNATLSTVEYRGDSRHPTDDNIFETGFIPKDVSQPMYTKNQVPNPISRTCITHQLSVASLFPFSEKQNQNTWIYILHIQHSDDYIDFSAKIPEMINSSNVYLLTLMYGQEANITCVPSSQIVGAVRCNRQFLNNEILDMGGIYQLKEYIPNENFKNCVLAKSTRDTILQLSNKWRLMPVSADGFQAISDALLDNILERFPVAILYMQISYESRTISFAKNMEMIKCLEDRGKGSRAVEEKPVRQADHFKFFKKSRPLLPGIFMVKHYSDIQYSAECFKK